MAHHSLITASDLKSNTWESATFPLVCQTCLGDNPYLRMICNSTGKECKICCRPYSSFRWQPGRKARYKNTVVCQACARMKNVCQVCLFDLEFGLPVQVRDKFLEESQRLELPDSTVGRDYALNKLDPDSLPYGKMATTSSMLLRLARTQPYYKRNQARICSFWVKGECKRGDTCPYRHETDPDQDPNLANQKIKNRFLGVSDPVAEKILNKVKQSNSEKPPNTDFTDLLHIPQVAAPPYDLNPPEFPNHHSKETPK